MTAAGTRARSRRTAADPTTEAWSGRYRDYDLVKEFVIALVVVSVLTVGLAALFSSPDVKQITISTWSRIRTRCAGATGSCLPWTWFATSQRTQAGFY